MIGGMILQIGRKNSHVNAYKSNTLGWFNRFNRFNIVCCLNRLTCIIIIPNLDGWWWLNGFNNPQNQKVYQVPILQEQFSSWGNLCLTCGRGFRSCDGGGIRKSFQRLVLASEEPQNKTWLENPPFMDLPIEIPMGICCCHIWWRGYEKLPNQWQLAWDMD